MLRLITLLLACQMIMKASSDCFNGFEHQGSSCYKMLPEEASWIEAQQFCRFIGSRLLIVEEEAEEIIIEGFLTKYHNSKIDEVFWLAGSDMLTETQWRWFPDESTNYPVNYTNWQAGRPDNLGGKENCMSLIYRAGQRTTWNDAPCSARHSVICEASYEAVAPELFG